MLCLIGSQSEALLRCLRPGGRSRIGAISATSWTVWDRCAVQHDPTIARQAPSPSPIYPQPISPPRLLPPSSSCYLPLPGGSEHMPAVSSTRRGANVAWLAARHPERRPAIAQTEPRAALVGKRASRQETNQINPAKRKKKQNKQTKKMKTASQSRVKINKKRARTTLLIKDFQHEQTQSSTSSLCAYKQTGSQSSFSCVAVMSGRRPSAWSVGWRLEAAG